MTSEPELTCSECGRKESDWRPGPGKEFEWCVDWRDREKRLCTRCFKRLQGALFTDPANFPRCNARGLLRTIEDGTLRINFTALFTSFTPAERRFWELSSQDFPADVHGPYPERIEQFFVLMEKSADMAKKKAAGGTATKERKKATTKVAKKKPLRTTMDEGPADPAVASAAEAKVAKDAKPAKDANDPNQPNLPGFETDRIPGIETAVKRIVNAEKERKRLKEEIEEDRGKITVLLEKNERSQYKCLGEIWFTEPGGTVLKRKKIKDK